MCLVCFKVLAFAERDWGVWNIEWV